MSRLASVAYPNGQSTTFDWYGNNNDNRLRGISHFAPGNIPRSQFSYSHNAGGEITRWAQQNAGLTPQISRIGYDKVSQLTSSLAGDGSASAPFSNQYFYGYDPASNRVANQNVVVDTARVSGTITIGDVVTITVKNSLLPGGTKNVTYTVASGDTTTSIASKLAANICVDTDMQTVGINAVSNTSTVSIKSVSSAVSTYSATVSGSATEKVAIDVSRNATQNITVTGTPTTGDILTLTVYDSALTGGNRAVSYTVAAGNTTTNIATGLKNAVNADSFLSAAGITATSATNTFSVKSTSPNLTTYKGSLSVGSTEKIFLAMNMNGTENIMIGGSKTTGDILTVNVYDQGLTGGKRSIAYTVLAADTLSTITTALSTAINADTQLQAIGVSSTASTTKLSVSSNSYFTTTYSVARSSGATETITRGINPNGVQTAVIAGTKKTGDVLTLTVFDLGLTGGSKAISYTVLAADTLNTIASALASAITADSSLSAIGVSATSVNNVVNIKSGSIHSTSYTQSLSAGSTESIFLAPGIGVTKAAHNNVNQVTNISAGGPTRFEGSTNKAVKSTSVGSQAIVVSSKLLPLSSFSSSTTGMPTESVTIDKSSERVNGQTLLNFSGTPTVGDIINLTIRFNLLPDGQQTVSYTVKQGDALANIVQGLGFAVSANQWCVANSVGPTVLSGTQLAINQPDFYKWPKTCSVSVTGVPTEAVLIASNQNGNTSATISGTGTTGDTVSIDIFNDKLPGGTQRVTRNVVGGDTASTIASALSTSINGNTNLAAIGLTASAAASVISISTSGTTFSSSTSVGATETISVGYNSQGNTVIAIGGVKTTGDTLTITVNNASLSGGTTSAAYTVLAADTLNSIASGLAAALNANTNLQTLGVSSTSADNATLNWSTNFSANPTLPSASSTAITSAVDGANNTKSDTTQTNVNSPSSQTLTFDLNGNMTSDGTNTYKWDAANRLIEIDYSGSGNKTVFSFDCLGRRVNITETTAGVSVKRIFVWSNQTRCEERDSSNAIVSKLFHLGQTVGSSSLFYSRDKLGSVRTVTDISGAVVSVYSYDPFGRISLIQGTLGTEDTYAGYFYHSRSGLNLTLTRPYNSLTGKFLNRDPLGVFGGINAYEYAWSNPVSNVDLSGMKPTTGLIECNLCKNFILEEGNNDFGLMHITKEHGPGVLPRSNTEPRSTWSVDAWKTPYIDRILKDVLCTHNPLYSSGTQDVYNGALYLVDVELQTGREVSGHAPVGLIYPPLGAGPPSPTFEVTVVTTNNLKVNRIITAYPGLP